MVPTGKLRPKSRLPFCRVHQNGDAEGFLGLDHLPTADEGEIIRRVLGIRKRLPTHPYWLLPGTRKPGGNGPISGKIDVPATTLPESTSEGKIDADTEADVLA
jgi:hypothetical protein